MKIAISLIILWLIPFILIFTFIYKRNQKETEEEGIHFFMVLFLSVIFSLIIAAIIGFILFTLLGSATIVNEIFSLKISKNELVILAISFLVYLFTLDFLVEFVMKFFFGKKFLYAIVLTFIRILIFYVMGNTVGLDETASIVIASGVSFIIFLIEVYTILREQ